MIYYDNKTYSQKNNGNNYVKNINTSVNKYTSKTKYFNNEKVSFEFNQRKSHTRDYFKKSSRTKSK